MTIETGVGLRERAIRAWREREERYAAEQVARDEREKGYAVERLEAAAREVLGAATVVTDVTFHQDSDELWYAEGLVEGTPTVAGRYGISMRFPCRSCGLMTVVCSDFTDLPALGMWLTARDAGERHANECAACWTARRATEREQREASEPAEPAPSVEERLLIALRAFVAENRRRATLDGDPEF